MSFVHLHVHSEYSLLEAACRLKPLVGRAIESGSPALALTDNGNMYGAMEFYFAALEKGLKPIMGLDAFFVNNRLEKNKEHSATPGKVTLLAKSKLGYQSLCKISSRGFLEGFYFKPRIDFSVLADSKEDVIAFGGSRSSHLAQVFLRDGPDAARKLVQNFKSIYQNNFYLELTRTGHPDCLKLNNFWLQLAEDLQIECIATNDVHYLKPEDRILQEVLIGIGSNRTLQEVQAASAKEENLYFKSADQMRALFKDLPRACDNTLLIAEQVNIKFKLKDESGKPIYHLPTFPTTEGRTIQDEIRYRSLAGLEVRFAESAARNEAVSTENKVNYFKRIDYELSVIDRMGFIGYFLIVQDFINWAKTKGIPVGPGRGSAAGSLVAYALRITDLDPIPYNLLFERFLNPERISMPDIDIDFCQDRRNEVIDYVTEKYGRASVSQIVTFGKLQTRAAIKDVGRTLGMTFAESDIVTKLIPDKLNITLKEALETEPRLTELRESDPRVSTLLDLAEKVEGFCRHAGIHAAGVIIADGDLALHAPLSKGAEGETLVQFDMKHAEKIGLIKFDFLGLKTLTLIQHALVAIEETQNIKLHANDISLNDAGIYEIMSAGDTAGIFQFEGDGITDTTRKIKPSGFTDITAINALYRPGPMAMIPDYTKRKNGESEVEYLLPQLAEVLKETYGIIVYQEQVMAIASLIAGYSLGEADMLRRAMGKKIKEEMEQHRIRFREGAKKNGHDEKKSEELFELMYKFADYGFNKSHAAAYCVVAAQTAWLKKNYAPEFYSALLSTELGDTDKIVKYVKDAQRHGIPVKPPHVNASKFNFAVKDNTVYFGLGAVKGLGESAVEAIIKARGTDGFKTIDDFFARVDTKRLNKKVMECLIKSGSLDDMGYHRADLMRNYSRWVDQALQKADEKASGQYSLFGDAPVQLQIESARPWAKNELLTYEKEVLGFYLSDHPLKGLSTYLNQFITGSISQLPQIDRDHKESSPKPPPRDVPGTYPGSHRERDAGKKRVIVAGMVIEFREMITKKGTRMAFGKLEDLSGACELVVFPDAYAKVGHHLKSERPILVGGLLEVTESNSKLIVDNIVPVSDSFLKVKSVRVSLEKLSPEQQQELPMIFKEYPGTIPVQFKVFLQDISKTVWIEAAEPMSVGVSSDLLDTIQDKFGKTDFMEMSGS